MLCLEPKVLHAIFLILVLFSFLRKGFSPDWTASRRVSPAIEEKAYVSAFKWCSKLISVLTLTVLGCIYVGKDVSLLGVQISTFLSTVEARISGPVLELCMRKTRGSLDQLHLS